MRNAKYRYPKMVHPASAETREDPSESLLQQRLDLRMGGIGSEMIERFNVFGRTWQAVELRLFRPASQLGLLSLGSDRVLLLGGREENGSEICDVWLYDFDKESITQQSSLNCACAVLGISQSAASLQVYGRNNLVEYTLPAEESR